MKLLLQEIRACQVCKEHLPLEPFPIVAGSKKSKIVLIGQAPGRAAHIEQTPWKDMSGNKLRDWLGVDEKTFYNPDNFAIMPMGFCFPGKGKSGDMPPRKECAPLWHDKFLEAAPNLQLKILIGSYATKYYLGKRMKKNLTETVMAYNEYLPEYLPLAHPSPLNLRWMKRNPWFSEEVLPVLKIEVKKILGM